MTAFPEGGSWGNPTVDNTPNRMTLCSIRLVIGSTFGAGWHSSKDNSLPRLPSVAFIAIRFKSMGMGSFDDRGRFSLFLTDLRTNRRTLTRTRQGFEPFVGSGSLDPVLPCECCSAAETIMTRTKLARSLPAALALLLILTERAGAGAIGGPHSDSRTIRGCKDTLRFTYTAGAPATFYVGSRRPVQISVYRWSTGAHVASGVVGADGSLKANWIPETTELYMIIIDNLGSKRLRYDYSTN